MKTKLSKRLISALLAVMLLVTSVPLTAVSVFAADEDPAVTEVKTAMTALETKLASEGAFVNVPEAYAAYVDAQEALDAYTYGGETDALNGVADNLNGAVEAIAPFAYPGVKEHIPQFANSTEEDMAQYENEGYNNVLFSGMAAMQTDVKNSWGTTHRVYYSPDTVVFYDGKSDILIPVMASAHRNTDGSSYGSNNYLRSAFPGDANGDNPDGWYLAQAWNQGDAGDGSNMNWNWNWWSSKPVEQGGNGVNRHVAYNFETGRVGVFSGSLSVPLPAQDRNWNWGAVRYDYSDGAPTFVANVLTFKGTPADYGQSYTLNWFVTSGGNGNADYTSAAAANPIRVINYKTLADALMRNGDKMKDILLSDYAEGGLEDYIYAMEDMAQFDPNLFFVRVTTGLEGYEACVAEMKRLVSAADSADTSKKDSAEYDTLRTAMNDSVRKAYAGGQNGYTDESWAEFKAKYEAAQAVMADVNNNGYTAGQDAVTKAGELDAAFSGLQTKAAKVDASALITAVDRVMAYDSLAFTAETYENVTKAVNAAKIAVWGEIDDYKISNAALDDSPEAQAKVAEHTEAVISAEKTLRLSMDYEVSTGSGRYSLNSASALVDTIADPTVYANYVAFETAVNNAGDYVTKATAVELTDYDAQVAEYTTYVSDIANAYANLQYSFTKIPDGTVANASDLRSLKTLKSLDAGEQFFDFAYTPDAVIIKTTRDPITVKYGKTEMGFGTSYSNSGLSNNMLDSINICTTNNWENAGPTAQNHITSHGPFRGDCDPLKEQQKIDYAGNLRNGQFALNNVRFAGRSPDNVNQHTLILADGTAVTDHAQILQMDLTDVIGTTDGTGGNPTRGGLFAQSNGSSPGYVYLTSDLTVDLPALQKVDPLNSNSGANTLEYVAAGNLGVVTVWNAMNTTEWCGYNWLNSWSQYGEMVDLKVTVIDIATLVEMVDLANKELPNSSKYTPDSWANFTKYLEAAQMPLDYKNMDAPNLRAQCHKRYIELRNAYKALEENVIPVTFTYKNAEGQAAQYVIEVSYGNTLSQYSSELAKVLPSNYVEGDYEYTWTGEWNPALDKDAPVVIAMTYDAVYEQSISYADFDAYNIAKTELLNALQDEKLSAESLDAAAAMLTDLKFFDYSQEQQAEELAGSQDAINAEAKALTDAKAALVTVTYDTSVAEALENEITVTSKNDPDMYGKVQFDYYRNIEIVGKLVKGLIYTSQDQLNTAIKAAVEGMKPAEYHIYYNGSDLGTAPYGTSVVIDSEGKLTFDADNADGSLDGSKTLAWSYSYAAPSNDNKQTAPKFICTDKAYGFVVKGDTYVTSENAESSEDNYVVTIYSSINHRIVEVINTNGTFKMPSPYTYPFYRFAGYSNGAASGEEVTVDKDTSIVANYEPIKADTFQVDYFKGYQSWINAAPDSSGFYNYNQIVELSDPDAYCWVKATIVDDTLYTTENEILAFGTKYKFAACENLGDENTFSGIVSITKAQYEGLQQSERDPGEVDQSLIGTVDYLVDGSGAKITAEGNMIIGYTYKYNPVVSQIKTPMPVYAEDNNTVARFTLIGRVAVPEGYKVVETGFMFSTDPKETNFDVDNANNSTLFRYKTSKITTGNQFAIEIVNPSFGVEYQYAAYAILKDAEGNLSTHYTNPVAGDNKF